MALLDKLPKAGRVYRYKALLFWAQGGLVCIEDTSAEGEFKTVTAAEFAARVITVRRLLERHAHKYADERNEDWNFIVNGAACVKEARRQGDPFDPAVLEELLRSRKRSYIYTGDSTATVTFDPVVAESGGVAVAHAFKPGQGQSVTLHTVSQDHAPDQAAQLPPLPTKEDKHRRK